jgi:outer membrane biosynthesis protein TonB
MPILKIKNQLTLSWNCFEKKSIMNKNFNPKAAIISIGAHIALLLLCLFIGYTLPASSAPPEEMGMEVNLGNSEDAYGLDQTYSTDNPAIQPEESELNNTDNNNTETPNDLITDENDVDAAVVKTNPIAHKKQNNPNPVQDKNKAPQKPKILFPSSNGPGGNAARIDKNGGSEGNGTGNGDKGVAGGAEGAADYTGIPGNGTGGMGHSFTDRSLVAKPTPEAEFREGGKVVVRVTVNRAGAIIDKRIKSQANAELGRIALKKIEEVRFSKSETAPPEQFGDITFVFKSRAHK